MAALLDDVQRLMDSSSLVATVGGLAACGVFPKPPDGYRKLTSEEIEILRLQGNEAEDWSQIHVAPDFCSETVRNNRLFGKILLGRFTGKDRDLVHGVCRRSGVYDSILKDVHIADEAIIYRVGWLHRVFVGQRAAIIDCTMVTCGALTTFGCGTLLSLGVQTGERCVLAFAELDVNLAMRLVAGGCNVEELAEYRRCLQGYLDRIQCPCTVISEEAILLGNGLVQDTFVGPRATVKNASQVSNATILSSFQHPSLVGDGALVRDSILQAGSEVDSGAQLCSSLLCSMARAERNAKISGSLIGPQSRIGLGEVTSSLIGPYTSAHHQSLLIATIWPGGKGNVAHGANVGSNHTSRAPDQELWCGEGVFWGLGVNVSFPANLSRSPYSVVAAGVSCLPQRVEFPFSLIDRPAVRLEDIPSGWNEIRPAWMLAENAYAVKRRELRLAVAENSPQEMFHRDVVDMMRAAMYRLSSAEDGPYYCEKQIAGLGKNYLSNKARCVAIIAYQRWIDYYVLRGFQQQLTTRGLTAASRAARELLEETSNDSHWEHQREILQLQYARSSIGELMELLGQQARSIALDVEKSKAKDDVRGARIIDDYAEVHIPAERDPVVCATWDELAKLEQAILAIVAT